MATKEQAPNAPRVLLTVDFSYPSSPNAVRFKAPAGCYTIAAEVPGGERKTYGPYVTVPQAEAAGDKIPGGEWSGIYRRFAPAASRFYGLPGHRDRVAPPPPVPAAPAPAVEPEEADPEIYACPDGASCADPECVAENVRRAALRGVEADISREQAMRAHAGTSQVPERRGEQVRAEYADTLAADFANLGKLCGKDLAKWATLGEEFARYRAGFSSRYAAHLAACSRVMSVLVTGSSRFPGRRNAKRNDTADKRGRELQEFRDRALAAIRKELRPEDRPIMAGDDDATARLRAKLDKAKELQTIMKAANAAIRKNAKKGREAQLAALAALGLAKHGEQLLEKDFAGRIGFPDYRLVNNGAEIRRLEKRLASVSAAKEEPAAEIEGEAARIEDSPAENRVRLFYPGKPDADTRSTLKSAGFRFAPSLGCWQAYRNVRTLELAKRFAGIAVL